MTKSTSKEGGKQFLYNKHLQKRENTDAVSSTNMQQSVDNSKM